jgi:hypothetical protein
MYGFLRIAYNVCKNDIIKKNFIPDTNLYGYQKTQNFMLITNSLMATLENTPISFEYLHFNTLLRTFLDACLKADINKFEISVQLFVFYPNISKQKNVWNFL